MMPTTLATGRVAPNPTPRRDPGPVSRSLWDSTVDVLRGFHPPDETQRKTQESMLAYVLAHPDATSRDCTPDHVTASALIVSSDGARVLLALHGRAGRWFQTGGHLEGVDASLAAAALREATEESGLDDLVLYGDGPVCLDVHPAPCLTPGVRNHLDVQYLAVSIGAGAPAVSDESLDVRWFDVDDLPADVDAAVGALAATAAARLSGSHSRPGSRRGSRPGS